MRKVVNKTSFLGGEAGYLLEGRSDLLQHQLGCSKIQNFINLKEGGVTRRPGTRYVKKTEAGNPARLLDFVVSYDGSGDNSYVVEITRATSTLVFRVIRVSDNSVYTPTGSPITVDAGVNIDELQYTQSADALFIVHRLMAPIVLTRTSTSPAFGVGPYIAKTGVSTREEGFSVPYRDVNITGVTLTAGATTGSGVTVTASSSIFSQFHIGAYFVLWDSGNTGYGIFKITAFTSGTVVTVTIVNSLVDTNPSAIWREGAWSDYRGWPRAITLYNQRLVFGGNAAQPDTFWMSQTGDYWQMFDIPGTPGNADPLSFTLASNKLNQIQWMVGGKKLAIGTSSSEWVGVVQENGTELLVQFDEETAHGSAYIQAKKMAYTVPFVQRARQGCRELVFNFGSDSYVATDLNLFASHIGTPYGVFKGSNAVQMKQIAIQNSPDNIIWVIDSVGRLYGLTRDTQQQIASWHSHVIGGDLSDNLGPQYPSAVLSICVVPSPNGSTDRLWMVVWRDEGYFVEYIDDIKDNPYITPGNSVSDVRCFLDCATLAVDTAKTTWTGYTRLASSTAYVVASDASGNIVQCGAIAVNGSGEITLTNAAVKVAVGLLARAEIRMLPLEGGNAPEINQRSTRRVDDVSIRLHESFGLRVGANKIARAHGDEEASNFEDIPFANTQAPIRPTFTGVKEVSPPTDFDHNGSYAFSVETPWPCTILSLSARVNANEV